jgi:biotin synthase
MSLQKILYDRILQRIKQDPENSESIVNYEEAKSAFELSSKDLLFLASHLRRYYFQNFVIVHIINNIRNGNCGEDCGYCAQRNTATGIPTYSLKSEEEILKEAEEAMKKGAYRYCLVTAGRGINIKMAEKFANIIKKINEQIGIKVCLSSGIITEPEVAKILHDAGLDRYNHNLNTSKNYYDKITTTHTYDDRKKTLENISQYNIGICSGVIAGMGETIEDLIEVGLELNRLKAKSIPVNFFIPVPGHNIKKYKELTSDECLKILSLFRLMNPKAEIRMAAGRELYLKEKQHLGLKVANSLFVSGYLNVKGSSVYETIKMIYLNGFQLDPSTENAILEIRDQILSEVTPEEFDRMHYAINEMKIELKSLEDLRPFAYRKNEF